MKSETAIRGIITLVGIILLMVLAYGYSTLVSDIFDQRMRRDIQVRTQELTLAGMTAEQASIVRSAVLDMNRNTLSYVSGQVGNVVGTFSVMGIIIMSFSLSLAGRIAGQKQKEGLPPSGT